MDFFSKLGGSSDKPQDQNPDHHKTSASDLFSSAKLVADAAKSSFGGGGESIDQGKVAGATADLLGAASDYGKLDGTKGIGKYVDQAEDYLNQYEKSHSAPHGAGPEPPKAEEPPKVEEPPKAEELPKVEEPPKAEELPKVEEPPKAEEPSKKEEGGSGFGDYLKVAEGFLKK